MVLALPAPPSCNLWRPPAYTFEPFLRSIEEAVNRSSHPQHTNMWQCVYLAPTHTGTTTLTMNMKPLSNKTQHVHRFNLSHHYRNGKRCIVMTLRDPVLRLRSAFSFERRANKPGREVHLLSSTRRTPTPSALVHELRNGGNGSRYSRADCMSSGWRDGACLVHLFNGSNFHNALWKDAHDKKAFDQFLTGNSALVPQIDYLVDLNQLQLAAMAASYKAEYSAQVELHLLCTERLAEEWKALLGRMEAGDIRAEISHWNSHGGKIGVPLAAGSAQQRTEDTSWLRMSPEDEDYVRTCMFPDDVALHRRYCSKIQQ